MEEKTINAIPAVPLGFMMGAISAVMAFIATVIVTVFFLPAFIYRPGFEWIGGLGGLWALVVPIAVFIVGFVQGLVIAVVYNFLASRTGGIKLHLQ